MVALEGANLKSHSEAPALHNNNKVTQINLDWFGIVGVQRQGEWIAEWSNPSSWIELLCPPSTCAAFCQICSTQHKCTEKGAIHPHGSGAHTAPNPPALGGFLQLDNYSSHHQWQWQGGRWSDQPLTPIPGFLHIGSPHRPQLNPHSTGCMGHFAPNSLVFTYWLVASSLSSSSSQAGRPPRKSWSANKGRNFAWPEATPLLPLPLLGLPVVGGGPCIISPWCSYIISLLIFLSTLLLPLHRRITNQ